MNLAQLGAEIRELRRDVGWVVDQWVGGQWAHPVRVPERVESRGEEDWVLFLFHFGIKLFSDIFLKKINLVIYQI